MLILKRILSAAAGLLIAGGIAFAADSEPTTVPIASVETDAVRAVSPVLTPVAATPMPAANGVRGFSHRLQARGITTASTLTGLWIGNLSGGIGNGGVYNSLGTFDADLDLAKSVGLPNSTLHGSLYWIRGRSVSYEFTGDALVVSNLDGFDSIRLYELWAEQRFAGDRLALRVGNQSVDAELAGTEYGGALTNSGFGWPASIAANVVNGGPIYFAPAFGARLVWQPKEKWNAAVGVYDGDSFDQPDGDPLPNQHGVHWSFGHGQGAFAIAEVSHAWGDPEDDVAQPGSWKLGLWRHSAAFEDNRVDASGLPMAETGADPAVHEGNQGWYAAFEQQLWRERNAHDQGLGAWLRVGGAPADRSAFEWVSDGGLHWTGLLPGRNEDILALGVVSAYVSGEAAQAAREQAAITGDASITPDFERVFEIAYRVRVSDRWSVTPDLQHVQHPGASGELPNAWVAGLRITFE